MTRRSLLLGLLAAAGIAAVTFFNDEVMKGTYLIGNFLPILVFGALMFLAAGVNPLLARLSRRAVLSGAELATIVGIALFACYASGRGLMHYFTTFLMLPRHHERTNPGWRGSPARIAEEEVLDWAALARALARPGSPALDAARDALPPALRERLAAGATPEGGDRAELLAGLNAAVAAPRPLAPALPPGAPAGDPLRLLARGPPEALDPPRLAAWNRGLLDLALADALRPRRSGVLERVPPRMLADPGANSSHALDGFVTGLAQGDERLDWRRIPWGAWRRTLLFFWGPLILTMGVAVIGLALVVHRQWAHHEHLPYPTVEFARAMLPEPGETRSGLFRSRLFWGATGVVLAIHLLNYAAVWWPESVIPVRTQFDFSPLLEIFPVFKRSNWWNLFRPTVYFTAIGFAYFLASDVSLSLGVAPFVYALAVGTAAGYGLTFGGGHLKPTIESFLYAGAYTAMFGALAWSGRRHYRGAFARGLGFPARDEIPPGAAWGARLALAGFAGFVLQLAAVGVEWPFALLYTFFMLMIMVVISRLLAEAGAFFVHAYFYPCALLWGFVGALAAGQTQLLLMAMVSSLLLIDPRETLMPFVVSSLRLADRAGLRPGRIAGWGFAALALSLVVAVPVSLYWQYQRGAVRAGDGWTVDGVPKFSFTLSSEVARTLEAQGGAELSERLRGLERFAHAVPQTSLAIAFATTFALVLLFTFLRHRFARWPLHPLLFLVLGTWQSTSLGFSFLLGWLAKRLVTKYGGAAQYARLKPLMMGLVAGEVIAGVIPVVVGAVYYRVTGDPPKPFRILPG